VKIYLKFVQKLINKGNFKGLDLRPKIVYPPAVYSEPLKKQFFGDQYMLYKVKENPVINFLYKDFFFTKKDFLIFYNNKFFDFFSLVLFKKSFSYDFFLKDIFHSTLLSYEENQYKYLSSKKHHVDSLNFLINNNKTYFTFLNTNFNNVNKDIKHIVKWLKRLYKESKKAIDFDKKNPDLNVSYALDKVIFEMLYNNDSIVFEVLYNKSIKNVPLYSHVNSFFKKIQKPKMHFFTKKIVQEYDSLYNLDYTYQLLGELFNDSGIFAPSDFKTKSSGGHLTVDKLSVKVKEHPEFSMVENYFYLDEYNYVYAMYNDVWALLYPKGELERDDNNIPLFSESMIMFEYTYYLSVGLIEYTSCIFFYEYNMNCILYHSLLYLYDIVLFY